MAKTVIRVMFDDATAAEGFLERCRGEGLDAVVEDARPIGTVKRNGPGLASWLKAHPGWHVVAESANRRAAWDAQAQNRDGRWVVIARRASKRRNIPGEGMDPLF